MMVFNIIYLLNISYFALIKLLALKLKFLETYDELNLNAFENCIYANFN